MPIDFEIQQGLRFVFTNLPNLLYIPSTLNADLIMFWQLQLQFYMQVVVTDRTFCSDELLLSGLAQMTELFSAEHRTFFRITLDGEHPAILCHFCLYLISLNARLFYAFTFLFCALNFFSFQKSGSRNLVREKWFCFGQSLIETKIVLT